MHLRDKFYVCTKKRKPLELRVLEFWLPCSIATRLAQLQSSAKNGLADKLRCCFILTRQWSVPVGTSRRMPEAANFRLFWLKPHNSLSANLHSLVQYCWSLWLQFWVEFGVPGTFQEVGWNWTLCCIRLRGPSSVAIHPNTGLSWGRCFVLPDPKGTHKWVMFKNKMELGDIVENRSRQSIEN